MIKKINGNEYEFKTTIGTIKRIEKQMRKPFMKIASEVSELTFDELQTLIACGIDNPEDKAKLKEDIDETMGLVGLMDLLEEFFEAIQFSGLTKEQIKEKKLEMEKKQA